MPQDEDQDLALSAFPKRLSSADACEHPGTVAMPQLPVDDVDAFLRAMGYNRIEREKIRRGQPRPRDERKYRTATVKRFRYYITGRLPNYPEAEIEELTEAWVLLTSYDLDLAQRWWAAGVDLAHPEQLADAINQGLRVQDLEEVVQGRTIAEHLQTGNSPTWCLSALYWKRSA